MAVAGRRVETAELFKDKHEKVLDLEVVTGRCNWAKSIITPITPEGSFPLKLKCRQFPH